MKLTRGIISSLLYGVWNPLDKNAGITLSGANRIGTRNATGAPSSVSVRATLGWSTGKRYFEITKNAGTFLGTGFGTLLASLAQPPGADVNGYGYGAGAGNIINGGVIIGVAQAYGVGETARFAIDFVNLKFWMSKVGSDWNGAPTADPATNTGGIAFAAGTYFPIGSGFDVPDQFTLNMGSAAFVGAIPSGFTI